MGETSGRRLPSASRSRWSTRSCGRHPTRTRSSSPWSEHFWRPSATSSRARSSPGSRCGAGVRSSPTASACSSSSLFHCSQRSSSFPASSGCRSSASRFRPRSSRVSVCADLWSARCGSPGSTSSTFSAAWPRSRSWCFSHRHRSSSSFASSQRTRESPPQRSLRSSCRRSCFSGPRSCTSTRPLD